MTASDDRCAHCGKPATKLCDHVLGYSAMLDESGLKPRMARGEPHTCDLPLCDQHAVLRGRSFRCGGDEGCVADTFDACPLHADAPGSTTLLTAHGVAALREDVARRARLTVHLGGQHPEAP